MHNIVWMVSEKLPQPFPCAGGECAGLPSLYRACTHTMLCRKLARNRPCVRPNLEALEMILGRNVPLGDPGRVDIEQWAATASTARRLRRGGRRVQRRRRRDVLGVEETEEKGQHWDHHARSTGGAARWAGGGSAGDGGSRGGVGVGLHWGSGGGAGAPHRARRALLAPLDILREGRQTTEIVAGGGGGIGA